jgi:hypothetical protein
MTIDHILCCIKEVSLCQRSLPVQGESEFYCQRCLDLESQDDYCPMTTKGCDAYRCGEV